MNIYDEFRSLLLSSSSHIFLPSKTFLSATIRAGAAFQEHQALDDEVCPEHQAFQERRDPGRSSAAQVFLSLIWIWSTRLFLSLIWWVFILFFYLDFRWLLGVDLVGCFVLVDLCLCFVLQHLLKFQEQIESLSVNI